MILLYKNGVSTGIFGYASGEVHEQATLTAVLEPQQGDAMTIVNRDANDDIFGSSYTYHTHFEGHLINRV